MAIVTPGQPGAIDNIDISQNTFRTQAGEVTSAVLRLAGGEVDSTSTTTLYVNQEIGSDKFVAGIADNTVTPPLSNQQLTCGYSESAPFKTLNRALIEAARLSVQSGVGNDLYDRVVIRVAASEYVIDNTPSTGLAVSQWPNTYEPTEEDLRAFNSDDMGIILPRGVSIIGADLRKSVIRPRSVPSAGGNPVTDRGSLFKTTGGSFFFNFTFKDSLNYTSSHHLLQAFSFCSQSDLVAYYQKVATAFGIPSSDVEVINPGETQITTEYPDNQVSAATDSVNGSSGYVFNCSLRSNYGMCGMYLDGSDGVSGLRSMVVAQFTIVSLQRDMNAWQIYTGGSWQTCSGYSEYINADSNDVRSRISGSFSASTGNYETDYRSFGFKVTNNALTQEVSCFVIGSSVHHWTSSGGECTITNSNSNFGNTALLSSGFRGIGTTGGAFAQDKGFQALRVRRPLKVKTDGSNIRRIGIGNVSSLGYDSATGTINLQVAFDPETTFANNGYSLKEGDYIWIENNSRTEGPGASLNQAIDVRAKLASVPLNSATPTQIIVVDGGIDDPSVNNISTIPNQTLEGNRVYIRRLSDTRKPEEREYSLIVSGSSTTRRPVGNYILRLGNRSTLNQQLDPANNSNEVFIVSTSKDSHSSFGSDVYKIVIRPGDSASSFNSSTFYRVGTPVLRNNRVFRSKRNKRFSTFSTESFEASLPMLPDERGVELLRTSSGPLLVLDSDLSNSPTSTDLGINQSTNTLILDQVRSSTDFQGVSSFMRAIGYTAQNVGIQENGTLSGTILEQQDTEASRDWNPADPLSPVPSGKIDSRTNWPLEFNRPSLIRAFAHAYEFVGYGNYTKALPKYQATPLSQQNKIDFFAVNLLGGRCYNTGFNEDGLLVQGNVITDLGTNQTVNSEIAGLGALAGDPDFPVTPTDFETLNVTQLLQSSQRTELTNEVLINGTVEGSVTFADGVLPEATETQRGVVKLATDSDAAGISSPSSANDVDALTAKNLGSVRGVADGLCDLDSTAKIPVARIPDLDGSGLVQNASTTVKGIVELATGAETLALSDATRTVTPSSLSSARGVANGFASLDATGLVPVAQIPPVNPSDVIKLTPALWVNGSATNFDNSTNFTFVQNANTAAIDLGTPLNAVPGTSGFILVTRGVSATTPFTSINGSNWSGVVNTFVSPITNSEGLSGNVLIGYYIATSTNIVFTASMVA